MSRGRAKGPRVIVDFSDELARQLSASLVREVIKEALMEEASLDVKAAAAFLNFSETEFRRRAKKIPVADYSDRLTRYRLKDLIEYRDKNVVYPKK